MKQYFHGGNQHGPYFEGWYFKCQTREGYSLALIPALHIQEDGRRSTSIQVITEDQAWFLEYSQTSFVASMDKLRIVIDGNCFSEDGLILNLEKDGLSLHGRVTFGPFQFLKSDIMGPFRWINHMECVHSVISMEHQLYGQVDLNGQILDFSAGTGYIEADRGKSFPNVYLWTQCMWNNCSLMMSIATIPFGMIRFTGCICAMNLDGQEYRIATYRGAKIRTWSSRGAVLDQGKYRLEVMLWEQKAQPLRAPSDGNMNRTVHESLCAKVRYRFWRGTELLFDHTDAHASYEYAKKHPNQTAAPDCP